MKKKKELKKYAYARGADFVLNKGTKVIRNKSKDHPRRKKYKHVDK